MRVATYSQAGSLCARLPGNKFRLAVRREDRDGQHRRSSERQLVQVMPLVEGIRRRPCVRVEVDLRPQQRNVRERIEFRPTTATCRNELLDAWRGAREVARERGAELTDSGIEGEAQRILRIVIENAED